MHGENLLLLEMLLLFLFLSFEYNPFIKYEKFWDLWDLSFNLKDGQAKENQPKVLNELLTTTPQKTEDRIYVLHTQQQQIKKGGTPIKVYTVHLID